jgi:hypothetical protein
MQFQQINSVPALAALFVVGAIGVMVALGFGFKGSIHF